MKWNVMIGTMVAVGLLGTTAVRAQETSADNAAASTSAQQNDGAASANAAPAYGAYVDGPATVDADGVPVAKPNAMSDFMKRDKAFNDTEVEQPLVDDQRTDSSASQPTK
jgi:hypothetical protein